MIISTKLTIQMPVVCTVLFACLDKAQDPPVRRREDARTRLGWAGGYFTTRY